MDLKLLVKRYSSTAVLPVRETPGSAGYDLASSQACIVPGRGKALVSTDLGIALPEGVYGRVAPRSGVAWKNHIDIGAGVIDRDYRGKIGIVVFNHSEHEFEIKVGDRIAQLILERYATAEVVEVDELSVTGRGTGGFGSTGSSSASSVEKKTEALAGRADPAAVASSAPGGEHKGSTDVAQADKKTKTTH